MIEKHLAHWLKSAVGIGQLQPQWYERRVAAIAKIAKDASPELVLELVRLYTGLPSQSAEARDLIVGKLQAGDLSFNTHDVLLLQLLAAITCIKILENGSSNAADVTSLGCSIITFQHRKKNYPEEPVSQDLTTSVKKYLAEETLKVRRFEKVSPLKPSEVQPVKLDFNKLKTHVESGNPYILPAFATDVQAVLENINTNLSSQQQSSYSEAVESINKVISSYNKALSVTTEENNILSWLLGQFSRDLERPFDTLSTAETSLLAGKELADLTKLQPGHYSAKAFLHRILKHSRNSSSNKKTANKIEEISILEAIQSVPQEIRLEWSGSVKNASNLDIYPLHSILQKVETVSETENVFERLTGLDLTTKFAAHELAYQFYQERLLTRLV